MDASAVRHPGRRLSASINLVVVSPGDLARPE
jgi:hypothetical protein